MNPEDRRAAVNDVNKVSSHEGDEPEPERDAPSYKPGHVLEAKTGGYLVLSRTQPGAWWLVFGKTCSCPAGRAGAERCWHRHQVAAFCKAIDAEQARPVVPVNVSAMVD